ncbi:MAG: hypothetical protein CM15mP58_07580 [Burkholderiaceae bacterium]|nr:MAG: hypothetical protein CM15mP58_07580 [Burkholderiaceae bacterium]
MHDLFYTVNLYSTSSGLLIKSLNTILIIFSYNSGCSFANFFSNNKPLVL